MGLIPERYKLYAAEKKKWSLAPTTECKIHIINKFFFIETPSEFYFDKWAFNPEDPSEFLLPLQPFPSYIPKATTKNPKKALSLYVRLSKAYIKAINKLLKNNFEFQIQHFGFSHSYPKQLYISFLSTYITSHYIKSIKFLDLKCSYWEISNACDNSNPDLMQIDIYFK